jgi:adenine-specific DNA-methyltransferase
MARRRTKPAGATPVESIRHGDKRVNLPTADAHDLVTPEVEAVGTVTYPREISTPMLVWQGKEALDARDLEVDAPPIYIQEKIDPQVLVENLRRTAASPAQEPELSLFESFDGLEDLDLVEFYRHEANWSNRMILGDSLQVMASLESRERLRGKVQMIYMDPPYGIKFGSNWQVSARKRDVKDGKVEDIAREVEQIKAFRDTWELGIHSYLTYLRDRLQVARDLLTESGSIFVQMGDENVHLVRCLMDETFGSENFVVSIVVKKKSATTATDPVNDYLLWYARDRDALKQRPLYDERRSPEGDDKFNTLIAPNGQLHRISRLPASDVAALINAGCRWARVNYPLVSQDPSPRSRPFEWNGKTYVSGVNSHWRFDPDAQMPKLAAAGRLFDGGGKSLGGVVYWNDWPYLNRTNIWDDVHSEQQPIYVVQTNTKLVERCVLMTTDPGDLVLDPTCGSGTTAFVAEQWGRRWITIDTSRVALALARQRLMGARFPYYLLRDSVEGRAKEGELAATPLAPAEVTNDIRHGFVYERVQHITLKSIANNPDIREGMSREEIDAAIKRHAEFEELVDRPHEDKGTVRVTGPFTVESLSPHRSLAFAPSDEPVSIREAAVDPDAPTFEQSIIENLRAAGIQNGRKQERLTFDVVEPYAGTHVQVVGVREDAPADAPSRVGISVGPQYGTVSPRFVKDAAREAGKAADLDLLCILGFAFDPQVLADDEVVSADESFSVAKERALGRIPVLLVRMNADLLMGEELKKTGAGNLFTVFGEPDIDVRSQDGQVTVEVRGVDVFDPTTGEIRSGGTDQIALWMIDTDYDDESFFVRHCYFTGGQDPYKRLKQALKADIDADAWSALNRTTSMPFDPPSTGRIAVKVINDYGDEVVKVFDV